MGSASAFRTFRADRHVVTLSPEQEQHRRNRIALILALVGGVGMGIAASGLTVSDILSKFPF